MDDKAVFAKTDKGWTEIRTRSLRLDRASRFLLVGADGKKSLAELAQQYGLNGQAAAPIAELLALELIAPVGEDERSAPDPAAATATPEPQAPARDAPAPAVDAAHDPAAAERFDRAVRFLQQAAPDLMGREAGRFLARVSLCTAVDHLLPLIPEYRALVGKRSGYATADVSVRRLLDIIGPLPPASGVIR